MGSNGIRLKPLILFGHRLFGSFDFSRLWVVSNVVLTRIDVGKSTVLFEGFKEGYDCLQHITTV